MSHNKLHSDVNQNDRFKHDPLVSKVDIYSTDSGGKHGDKILLKNVMSLRFSFTKNKMKISFSQSGLHYL